MGCRCWRQSFSQGQPRHWASERNHAPGSQPIRRRSEVNSFIQVIIITSRYRQKQLATVAIVPGEVESGAGNYQREDTDPKVEGKSDEPDNFRRKEDANSSSIGVDGRELDSRRSGILVDDDLILLHLWWGRRIGRTTRTRRPDVCALTSMSLHRLGLGGRHGRRRRRVRLRRGWVGRSRTESWRRGRDRRVSGMGRRVVRLVRRRGRGRSRIRVLSNEEAVGVDQLGQVTRLSPTTKVGLRTVKGWTTPGASSSARSIRLRSTLFDRPRLHRSDQAMVNEKEPSS